MTFEENLERLGELVGLLENDKLPLEKALECYKEGVELSAECTKELEKAKVKVKMMNGDIENE